MEVESQSNFAVLIRVDCCKVTACIAVPVVAASTARRTRRSLWARGGRSGRGNAVTSCNSGPTADLALTAGAAVVTVIVALDTAGTAVTACKAGQPAVRPARALDWVGPALWRTQWCPLDGRRGLGFEFG